MNRIGFIQTKYGLGIANPASGLDSFASPLPQTGAGQSGLSEVGQFEAGLMVHLIRLLESVRWFIHIGPS